MRHLLLPLLLVHGVLCQQQSADLDDMDDAIGRCFCNGVSYGPDVATGEFKSPLHPNSYCDNHDCKYEIEPAPSFAVMLIIESLQTELRHDWLEVLQVYQTRNGLSDVRMLRMSGEDRSFDGKKFVTARDNGLRLHFHTDGSEHRWQGFRARFVRFNESADYNPCPPVYYDALSAPTALIGPPRSSGVAECLFMINATERNTDAVQLTMQSIALDTEVRVFEAEDAEALALTTPIQTYRGTTFATLTADEKTITSRGKSLLVVFVPTARTSFNQASIPTYFRADFTRVVSPCHCQTTPYTVDAVTRRISIQTPGFPKDYCDNLKCVYDLQGRSIFTTGSTHSALKLTFHSFDMENNVDYVTLYDTQITPRLLMGYTGAMVPDTVFTFNFFKAQLQMVTDLTVVRKGFNATVEEIERDNACKCSQRQPREYSGMSETIAFEMPSEQLGCNYVDCFWMIIDPHVEGDVKHRIVMEIEYRLHRIGETILIQNGANPIRNERAPALEHKLLVAMPTLNGAETTKETLEYNAAGGLLIWFHSAWDRPTVPEGHTTTAHPPAIRRFTLKYQWKERCMCGASQLTAGIEWTMLTSPDFPGEYCHSLRCTHIITAPDNHRVVVNITRLETEANEDFLGLYDGQSTMTHRMEWASGMKYYEHSFKSTNRYMTVLFTTDVSIAFSGFSLLYRAESLNPETAREEDARRKEMEEEARVGKRGGSGWSLVFVLLLIATVVGAAFVLVQHRRGRVSLGAKVDAFLGGGTQSSGSIGFMNGGTSNQGYTRHFSAPPSEMSPANDDD